MKLNRKGVYEVSGLAWSGAGGINQVEVSADGGNSWATLHCNLNTQLVSDEIQDTWAMGGTACSTTKPGNRR